MGETFFEGSFEESMREQRRFAYERMQNQLEDERREEEQSSWTKVGDNNVVKADRIPSAKPEPWHPGDDEKYS